MPLKKLLKRSVLFPAVFALSLAFIFCFTPFAGSITSATFIDVPGRHPNFEAITYVKSQNIVDGYPDGLFRPDNHINRAEFTKILIEANYKGQATGNECFPDVGAEWFAKYVCFGKINNIFSGYPDGFFKPANNINFVEAAKIIVNVHGPAVTTDYEIWYKPYVEKLAEAHAIPSSITSFDQKMTRGEVAEIIYRLKADVTDKSSKTYEELVVENASFLPANHGIPLRIRIPAISVNAAIEEVGLTAEGAVDIPQDPDNAAWLNLGPRPGEVGSAIITGHINWYYGATGVFANLSEVKVDDKIIIEDDKGTVMSFVVREIRSYDAEADAINVFSSTDGKAHLNLITCEGVWNSASKSYSKRLVIFTDKE